MSTPLRVVLADDHPVVRQGLRTELEQQGDFVVVGEVGLVAGVMDLARQVKPQVVVMDMRLSDGSGVEATTQVLAVSPESRVLVLSVSVLSKDVVSVRIAVT